MGNNLLEQCHKIKEEISNETTFHLGIENLLSLRTQLFDILAQFKVELCRADFNAIPFIGEDGFHSKTIAYSIWHIFRIEDIVTHTLINKDNQIFFSRDYKSSIGSPIITTGNELEKQEISDFSKTLNLDALYEYAESVKDNTNLLLKKLSFCDLERRMTDEDRENLKSLHVVSDSENARWLIDYWCGENIRGLIMMPFSEHWLAHIYASWKIKCALKGISNN